MNKSVASVDKSIEEETNGIAVSMLPHKYIDRLIKAGLEVQYDATSQKQLSVYLTAAQKMYCASH